MFYSYSDLDKHGWDIAFDGETLGDWAIGANLGAYNVTVAVPYKAILPKDYDGILVPCRALGVDRDISSCVRMNLDMKKVAEAAAEGAVAGYKKIEKAVVSGYKKIEDGVVGGYKKIEEGVVEVVETASGYEQAVVAHEAEVLAVVAYGTVGDDSRYGLHYRLFLFIVTIAIESLGTIAAPICTTIRDKIINRTIKGQLGVFCP